MPPAKSAEPVTARLVTGRDVTLSRRSATSQQTCALVSVRSSIVNDRRRMKGSLMTENPAQGASPENREPATPNEGESGRPQAAPAPDSPQDNPPQDTAQDSPQENPTLRLDRAAGNPPQPVYPQHQPSYGRPPAPETQQFGAPQEYVHQGSTPGQPNPQHTPGTGRQRTTPLLGSPSRAAPSKGLSSTASLLSARPSTGVSGATRPVPRMPPTRPTPRSARPPSVSRTLVASILAAGLVGGGVVAGTTQLMDDRSSRPPDPATAARPAPSSSITGKT